MSTSLIRLFSAAAVLLAAAPGVLSAATINRVIPESTVAGAPVSVEQVDACMVCKPGGAFDAAVLSEDIKRLFQSGLYADVQQEVKMLPGDKVDILLKLTPQATVRDVTFAGNEIFENKKLSADLLQTKGAVLDNGKVAKDVSAIRKLYEDKGYYGTTVTSEIAPVKDGKGEVTVLYRIQEEKRYKIDDIVFIGNAGVSADELKKKIQTKFSVWSLVFPTNYLDADKLQLDKDAITELYTNRGYFDFKFVGAPARKYSANGKWVTVEVTVAEGARYNVTTIDMTGNRRFSKDELLTPPEKKRNLDSFPVLKPGEPFSGETERAMIERIRAKYDSLGYIDLKIYPRHAYDSAAHTVAVTFELLEGVPSKIRDIQIGGNEITKSKVIRRELAIQSEDLADGGKIRASKSRLMGLNYFETVDIIPLATEKEDEKDLQVAVKEKKTGNLMLGAGFSTEDSLVGMMELSQSNFDWLNWPTFTGGGQRMKLRVQAGTERQDYVLSFTEPWLFDRPLRLDWDLYGRERDQEYYTEKRYGTQALLTRPLVSNPAEGSEWQYWRHSAGIRYDYITLDDFDKHTEKFLSDQEGSYNVGTLIYRISRDTRDRTINPTEGSHVQLTTELSPEALGTYSNVYRLDLQGSKYYPVKKCVLKLEAEAGVVDSLSGDDPALFDRWFAGGAGSIRGFKRREVGPTDRYENAAGGDSLLRGTVEFIYPIVDMVRGSVFTDFGNVWSDAYAIDPADINVSVGVGLQLDLPIGPIRLDYGIPVITREDHLSHSGRFHFGINYFF